jgi:predicted site-specific integrase-resolvase
MPPLDLDALWTVAEVAGHCGVSEAAVRSWVYRGHLKVAERDCRGRPRFLPLDAARAEYATRERARRVVTQAA